jgi:hypothetical protein
MLANVGIAPMLPFMASTTPAAPAAPEPLRERMRPPATISKLSDHGFESLTTRLLPVDQNKKLN